MDGKQRTCAHIVSLLFRNQWIADNCVYFNDTTHSILGLAFLIHKENSDIQSYVHCVTQGFFFCNREVCSPGTVSLLMFTTHQVLTTGEHTHIHHNGQSTCELRQSLVLHFFSLFVFAGVQKTIERRFQPARRVSSFSCLYIVR